MGCLGWWGSFSCLPMSPEQSAKAGVIANLTARRDIVCGYSAGYTTKQTWDGDYVAAFGARLDWFAVR